MSVGNQTTATLTGLERGTKYYVVTIAVDAQGNQSRPSNEIEDRHRAVSAHQQALTARCRARRPAR